MGIEKEGESVLLTAKGSEWQYCRPAKAVCRHRQELRLQARTVWSHTAWRWEMAHRPHHFSLSSSPSLLSSSLINAYEKPQCHCS